MRREAVQHERDRIASHRASAALNNNSEAYINHLLKVKIALNKFYMSIRLIYKDTLLFFLPQLLSFSFFGTIFFIFLFGC